MYSYIIGFNLSQYDNITKRLIICIVLVYIWLNVWLDVCRC